MDNCEPTDKLSKHSGKFCKMLPNMTYTTSHSTM